MDTDRQLVIKAGSRIIPMDAATLGDYEKGNLKSPASERTDFRGTRRLYERAVLRRERLLRVLHVLGWLPWHYEEQIDWTTHPGQFIGHGEPLLPYRKTADGHREFIFMDSFREMLAEFTNRHPELTANGKKIPYDWTIYYLRKKALTRPVTREELAWIILNFNAKRGYYQLCGKDDLGEETTDKLEEYRLLTVKEVVMTGSDKKRADWNFYDVVYEDGVMQRKAGPVPPRKPGDLVEVIVTTQLGKDGKVKLDKEGKPRISLRDPKDDDWTLMKKRSEKAINEAQVTVGTYIFDNMLEQPDIKVRGKLVRTIERKYYRDELEKILRAQAAFLPELNDSVTLQKCVRELYRNNESHVASALRGNLAQFIVDDIIFYQRPLKSKKSEIADCPYETYHYIDKETGEIVCKTIKCVPRSNPIFQEFRLWQFIGNLRICEREKEVNGKTRMDVDVTDEYLHSPDDICDLFDFLSDRKDINQKQLLAHFHLDEKRFRWNFVEDKTFPCNETHSLLRKAMDKVSGQPRLTSGQEQQLWHILYSVDDAIQLEKALESFARSNGIDAVTLVDSLKHAEPFADDYGAYSEKAIKKLLPLMRTGRYWSADAIAPQTRLRIDRIVQGEDEFPQQQKGKNLPLRKTEDFQRLPVWLACYVVYGRHSEAADTERWEKPADIDRYLREHFRQHALRNPIVEKVLGETLRVVRDVWKTYGKIDEVHVEMGRDLKAPAQERARMTQRIRENEQKNLRIRKLLQEFACPEYGIEGVRPQSPSQQEILKIYEDTVLNDVTVDLPDDIRKISGSLGNPSQEISKSDVNRYKLWLEQQYRSPYTGRVIPLSKLFTPAYEIEHVIPQSRYFDDSLSNKVICESEVNKYKDRMFGYEFIVEKGGSIIPANLGGTIRIFDKTEYEEFVKKHYAGNRSKMRRLLMDDLPDGFIERQMNDSRYMARQAIGILSHLVRDKDEDAFMSKHVLASNGRITDRLKKEWGIGQVWNDLVAPRFMRMNNLTGSNAYGEWVTDQGHRWFRTSVPLELSRGFSKKRIDHRHHAMDAIVIACTTRDHINYLNNVSARAGQAEERYDLKRKLCEKVETDANGNYVWQFLKPWPTFTQDVREELAGVIVSFKQNLRVINRMTNRYWHYENGQKKLEKQVRGDGWSIRKSLHKDTVHGLVRLQTVKKVKLAEALDQWHMIKDKDIRMEVKKVIGLYKNPDKKTIVKYFKDRGYTVGGKDISRVEIYYTPAVAEQVALRTSIDTTFNQKKIDSVTDSGIRAILTRHLARYDGNSEAAFSADGIAEMNRNIRQLNNGHDHKPILKVRVVDALGLKFPVGHIGNKNQKYVVAAKGTNLFFAVYADEEGKRYFESIPFNVAVENEKAGMPPAPDRDEKGHPLLFTLSPNDLVYVPEEGEHVDVRQLNPERIWKMVSCTKRQCFFVPDRTAFTLADGKEYGSLNKVELTDDKVSIKAVCVKLKVNRLGICESVND